MCYRCVELLPLLRVIPPDTPSLLMLRHSRVVHSRVVNSRDFSAPSWLILKQMFMRLVRMFQFQKSSSSTSCNVSSPKDPSLARRSSVRSCHTSSCTKILLALIWCDTFCKQFKFRWKYIADTTGDVSPVFLSVYCRCINLCTIISFGDWL